MEKLHIIQDEAGVYDLIDYLKDKTFITFDTETTGVEVDSEIIGMSVCAEANIAYYIVLANYNKYDGALEYWPTKTAIMDFLKCLFQKSLIMHNGIFDCSQVWNNYKVSLIEFLHTDTMVLAHLLDENRRIGLKELGVSYYGADAKKEQEEMRDSVLANGGELTKKNYEMYKADYKVLGKYGAKDAILTYNIFYEMVPQLYEEGLDKFFYEDECMPLLRGPTYQMNTAGLKIDLPALKNLKQALEVEMMQLKAYINAEIATYVKDKYPATNKKNTFNFGSGDQIAWLLFEKLKNDFERITDVGKELAQQFGMKVPYTKKAKQEFIATIKANFGLVWKGKNTKVKDYWTYLKTDKEALSRFSSKYRWVGKLLEYKKLDKLLSTYVDGIEEATRYGIIRPNFLQTGTTSGRYSCRRPNFQNLPRDDKRVKTCVVSRPGKVFVGADESQLEPRIFASLSGDERLLKCFKDGEDFYSVIGVETFDKAGCGLKKEDPNSFASLYPELRHVSKVIALSATYGTTAPKMAPAIKKTKEEAQEILDSYFTKFPRVKNFMKESHEMAKKDHKVVSLFGRPRRMVEAKNISKLYSNADHADLPYWARNILNLAVNHRIQSTAASIMNRAAIAFCGYCLELAKEAAEWLNVQIVLQVHDELIVECPEDLAEEVAKLLKHCMENTVELPGVSLLAEPKIGRSLAELK